MQVKKTTTMPFGETATWQLAREVVLSCLVWPSMKELVITVDPRDVGYC